MIGGHPYRKPVYINDFSFEKHQTTHRILLFIKNWLPEFEALVTNCEITPRLEDEISKELFRFFNNKSRTENLLFQFNEKKGVDFTIYFANPIIIGASSIFMIEAKRLSKEHYDYVSGRTGGIERIKREQEQFGMHLNHGAMIGYIQDHNVAFWESKINSWIDVLITDNTDIEWNEQDKLIANNEVSDFTSHHTRISKPDIDLFHYWVELN